MFPSETGKAGRPENEDNIVRENDTTTKKKAIHESSSALKYALE